MVFKLVRSGKRIRELVLGIENDAELGKYIDKRKNIRRHPLHEDIEIINKYIDYIRFSRPASLSHESPPVNEKDAKDNIQSRGRTKFPFAAASDVISNPARWSGNHVIIDGSLQFVSSNERGEHWHRFSDGTGTLIAVGKENLNGRSGTLFGVARQTPVGKQLFVEIRNFHPQQI